MSENIGKDGEMRFAITIAGASIRENGLDFTRHTVTNQPDLGVDYSAKGPAEVLISFCEIGTGTELGVIREAFGQPDRKIEARFDIKTTEEKLAGDTVEKFVSDVKKHPTTDLHVLAGGSGLTKSAQAKFETYSAALQEDGKALVYIPNQGLAKLASEYKPEILSALGGPTGTDESGPGSESK
ncbi:hypothetical protein [Pseudogulbenkiania sp. MAI-1]|uniref:hypothetical protein n=1 Tax=Pseudogulbenkiania sp. MAI-1 TaxID=990370 RepID=UPI0012EC7126|nr:hypothetical protein [Pseudogulbenkiania sp. MAI-1]